MFMSPNEVLGSTAARTSEPEAEQNVQGGAENEAQKGPVVSVFVTGEMSPVKYRHAADRAFGVLGMGNIRQGSGNQNSEYQLDIQFRQKAHEDEQRNRYPSQNINIE